MTNICSDSELRLLQCNNDAICQMASNMELLTHYCRQAVICLREDVIFPMHPEYAHKHEEQCIRTADETMTAIVNSSNAVYKLAFVFFTMRTSPSFVAIFCPPPTAMARRFLVDPDKFARFVRGDNRLRKHISKFVEERGHWPVEHFVVTCLTDWKSYMPWLNHEEWSKLDPNTPSIELIQARKIENNKAHAYRAIAQAAENSPHRYLEDAPATDY